MAIDLKSAQAEPTDQDLQSLVKQLTLDEKISLLAAKNVWETPAIDRLNIPSLKVLPDVMHTCTDDRPS